jgi:predicted dehydrogenase
MASIDEAFAASQGSVMVGFNRRFAPATVEIKKKLSNILGPKTVAFHVFPGELKPDHWFANYAESGGRILGEGCHFLDFFCHLIDSDPVRVSAQTVWPTDGRLPFPDSVTAQVEFADGSCGQLIYTAQGDYSFPKEIWTVYAAGLIARCENFQTLEICQGRKKSTSKHGSKGHAEEMHAWQAFLLGKAPHPLPYEQSRRSMHLTFGLLESIQQGAAVAL